MSTHAEWLAAASKALAHVSDTPRLDAEILLAHAAGISRARLLSRLQETLSSSDAADALLERRLAYEPLAYILGEWEFFSLDFLVEPPMLVPRPETEHLVEAVLEHIGEDPARVLEIGVGTGCVAVSIACNAPAARVTGTDVNPLALDLTQRNAERHGVADRVDLLLGDLFSPLEPDSKPFDAICSNPPYVETGAWDELSPVIRMHEDPRALLAGPDGLDVMRRLIPQSQDHLKPGGLLALEIGMGQYDDVRQLMNENRYEDVGYKSDLGGIKRIILARKPD